MKLDIKTAGALDTPDDGPQPGAESRVLDILELTEKGASLLIDNLDEILILLLRTGPENERKVRVGILQDPVDQVGVGGSLINVIEKLLQGDLNSISTRNTTKIVTVGGNHLCFYLQHSMKTSIL